MNKLKGKKGQLGSLPSTVLIIIFALLMLGVGFLLVQEFLDMDNLSDQTATYTDRNVYINETGYTLSQSTVLAFNSPSITSIVNNSDGVTLLSGNYTLSSSYVITNASTAIFSDVNITYSYHYGDQTYNGVNKTITAFLEIPSLLGLLILVILIGIIIALLLGFTGGKVGTGA